VAAWSKGDEYRKFSIQHEHFKHSDKMLAQIKARNPKYTKATQSTHWETCFGRNPKADEKPFVVFNDKGQKHWLYDVSQTLGRPLQKIYQNFEGEVPHYQLVWDCLTTLISQQVVSGEDSGNFDKWQGSIRQDGKIVIRSDMSQQQKIFALVREIVRTNQTLAIVVEAVSHMVCRHLGFDTGAFSFGYLLELMGFDVSLADLKDKSIEDNITNEAAVLIGNLNGSLPFLQGSSSHGSSSGGNALELDEHQASIGKPKDAETIKKVQYSVKQRTETVNDLDFQTIAILRDFMRTLPDRTVSTEEMVAYGFHDTNMIPLREAVARKLFLDKREIYRLYKSNTFASAESIEDINKHSGLYGISANDWFSMKSEILRNSMDGEVKKISLWEQAAAGNIKQEGLKARKTQRSPQSIESQKQRKIHEQARSAQMNKQAEQDEYEENEENLEFDDDGNRIFHTPDIKHSDNDSYDWVDGTMEDLIDNHDYPTSRIPYFREHGELGLSSEMEIINKFMVRFCFFCISNAIEQHTERCKKTGKIRTFVMKAARQIFTQFNTHYVALALKDHWKEWKAHDRIKVQFYNDFKDLRKVPQPQVQRKKSTPEEDMARMKAKEEAKTTNTTENGQPDQNNSANRRNQIINLINAYRDTLKTKPKNATQNRPTVKAMREATQAR